MSVHCRTVGTSANNHSRNFLECNFSQNGQRSLPNVDSKVGAFSSFWRLTCFSSCRYFFQVTMGCGREDCTNKSCFSCEGTVSPRVCSTEKQQTDGPRLDPTSAALMAIDLARQDTHTICNGVGKKKSHCS